MRTPTETKRVATRFRCRSRIALGIAALAALSAAAASAATERGDEAPCTTSRAERIDALSSIGLRPEGFPPGLDGVTADAARLWNSAPCDATGRPRFLPRAPGERTIVVRWIAGAAASAPGVCGSFSGNEIRLYAFVHHPGRGRLEPCGDRARLVEILAHELGHALGLYDQRSSRCADRIMGQLVRRSDGSVAGRAIHAEECRAVGRRFVTLAERLERTRHEDPLLATIGPAAPAWGLQ